VLAVFRLDVGEGKEINLERCPRLKLLSQCIKYLGPVSLRKLFGDGISRDCLLKNSENNDPICICAERKGRV
jgi:hypothetical protein